MGLKISADRSSIVEQLKDQGVITKGMAGLYIEDQLDSKLKSQLRIGGYNPNLMGQDGEANIVWWPLIESTSWHLNLLDAKLGGDSFMPANSH